MSLEKFPIPPQVVQKHPEEPLEAQKASEVDFFDFQKLMTQDTEDPRDAIGFNEDVLMKIFERNNPAELAELKKFWRAKGIKVTENQLELCIYNAQLRSMTLQGLNAELKQRQEANSSLTDLEQRLGLYLERLEPQVRNAVVILNKKGYETRGSGFAGLGSRQNIYCKNNQFDSYLPSDQLVEALSHYGVEIKINPREISLAGSSKLSLEDWSQIWNLVADDLPEKSIKA